MDNVKRKKLFVNIQKQERLEKLYARVVSTVNISISELKLSSDDIPNVFSRYILY